jgi:hypothetical protein
MDRRKYVTLCIYYKFVSSHVARRALLGRATRAARLDDGERVPRQHKPPGAGLQPRYPHRQVRQTGALTERHDGAVRRAHHRPCPVLHLP